MKSDPRMAEIIERQLGISRKALDYWGYWEDDAKAALRAFANAVCGTDFPSSSRPSNWKPARGTVPQYASMETVSKTMDAIFNDRGEIKARSFELLFAEEDDLSWSVHETTVAYFPYYDSARIFAQRLAKGTPLPLGFDDFDRFLEHAELDLEPLEGVFPAADETGSFFSCFGYCPRTAWNAISDPREAADTSFALEIQRVNCLISAEGTFSVDPIRLTEPCTPDPELRFGYSESQFTPSQRVRKAADLASKQPRTDGKPEAKDILEAAKWTASRLIG